MTDTACLTRLGAPTLAVVSVTSAQILLRPPVRAGERIFEKTPLGNEAQPMRACGCSATARPRHVHLPTVSAPGHQPGLLFPASACQRVRLGRRHPAELVGNCEASLLDHAPHGRRWAARGRCEHLRGNPLDGKVEPNVRDPRWDASENPERDLVSLGALESMLGRLIGPCRDPRTSYGVNEINVDVICI